MEIYFGLSIVVSFILSLMTTVFAFFTIDERKNLPPIKKIIQFFFFVFGLLIFTWPIAVVMLFFDYRSPATTG